MIYYLDQHIQIARNMIMIYAQTYDDKYIKLYILSKDT